MGGMSSIHRAPTVLPRCTQCDAIASFGLQALGTAHFSSLFYACLEHYRLIKDWLLTKPAKPNTVVRVHVTDCLPF